MSTSVDLDEEPVRTGDRHAVLDGSRWHYPAPGDPTRCAVTGCTRVLGQTPAPDEGEDEDGDE